jgi:hypothetical protein
MKKILNNLVAAFVKTRLIILLTLLAALSRDAATAQIIGFGGSTAVLGTVNSSPVDTNTAGITVRRLSFALSGMTNSATMFTGSVYLSTSPSALNNALLLGQFTNYGSAAMSTNFSAYYTNPPLYLLLQGSSGTNTTFVQAIYGP